MDWIMRTRRVLVGGTVLALCCGMSPPLHSAAADELDQTLSKLRYEWQDNELPAEQLTLDPTRARPSQITSEQAVEDAERLFYLFSHGYSGYGFFADGQRWQEAREQILSELRTRSTWSVARLPALLRSHLGFICDCHIRIDNQRFAEHQDFWYDNSLELRQSNGKYECEVKGEVYSLVSINGQDPSDFLVPSLNRHGEPIHRIGMLAKSSPGAVVVEAIGESGSLSIDLPLRRSDFDHYSWKIFEQDRIGGIPVLRVRSFGDGYAKSLERWLETADDLKGEPCVIVDVRGNGGGNERWPIEWIRRLTGERAESVFIFSELYSRTTIAGRANAFARWRQQSPGNDYLRQKAEEHSDLLKRFEPGGDQPFWSGPRFPDNPTIPNQTTIIVITNGLVASAGEGFVMRVSQAENVVVVGENTMGALTFGNISLHQLPNSGLEVWMPINFGLFPDLVFREEKGLAPDYWVPAAEALDFAVAAVRNGTIATARPLPEEWLQQRFVPEGSRYLYRRVIVVCLLALVGGIWAFKMRRRRSRPVVPRTIWLVVGVVWILLGRSKGLPWGVDAGAGLVAFGIVLISSSLLLRFCRPGESRCRPPCQRSGQPAP